VDCRQTAGVRILSLRTSYRESRSVCVNSGVKSTAEGEPGYVAQ